MFRCNKAFTATMMMVTM